MQVRQGPQDLLVPVEPLGRRGCRANQDHKGNLGHLANKGRKACKVFLALRARLAPKARLALLVVIASPSSWNPPATSPLVQRTTTSCIWPMAIR